MTLKKWTSVAMLFIGSLLITMSCDDDRTTDKPNNLAGGSQKAKSITQNSGRIADYSFDGKEGDPISLATASSWVANYNSKSPNGVKSHFFGAATIKNILATNSCKGIRIYHSLDGSGNQELLLIGTDGGGRDFLPRIGIMGKRSQSELDGAMVAEESYNGTEGDAIDEEISNQWMANYASSEPSGLTAHFFGYEILNQILNEDGCVGIRMYYALNNIDVQQVLLVGVTDRGKNLLPRPQEEGREAGDPPIIGDASFPCPTYCNP